MRINFFTQLARSIIIRKKHSLNRKTKNTNQAKKPHQKSTIQVGINNI